MKRRKLFVLAAAALVAGFLFAGCGQAGVTTGIEVEGTWFLDSDYGDDYDETWVISDSSISYYSGSTLQWTGTVVSYDNDSFNASETGSGNYGYAAICYTYALNTGWGEPEKHNIFRWEDFTGSACDFTVGYKDATGPGDSDYTNAVAAEAAEAISDITAANSYFGGWSSGASLQ